MTSSELDNIIEEVRADFQIPPYISDETIERAARKCYARLAVLFGADFSTDEDAQGKMLVTNAVYYELNHRYEEFEPEWQPYILSWQLTAPSTEDSNET